MSDRTNEQSAQPRASASPSVEEKQEQGMHKNAKNDAVPENEEEQRGGCTTDSFPSYSIMRRPSADGEKKEPNMTISASNFDDGIGLSILVDAATSTPRHSLPPVASLSCNAISPSLPSSLNDRDTSLLGQHILHEKLAALAYSTESKRADLSHYPHFAAQRSFAYQQQLPTSSTMWPPTSSASRASLTSLCAPSGIRMAGHDDWLAGTSQRQSQLDALESYEKQRLLSHLVSGSLDTHSLIRPDAGIFGDTKDAARAQVLDNLLVQSLRQEVDMLQRNLLSSPTMSHNNTSLSLLNQQSSLTNAAAALHRPQLFGGFDGGLPSASSTLGSLSSFGLPSPRTIASSQSRRPAQNYSRDDSILLPNVVIPSAASLASSRFPEHWETDACNTSTWNMKGPHTFPMILHQALLELELIGATDVACFLPNGEMFQIKSQFWFEKRVIAVFFPKMKGFASFQRQLNLYNFVRVGGFGTDRGSYRHDLFHRDFPSRVREMKRTKIKRNEFPKSVSRNEASQQQQEQTASNESNAFTERNASIGDDYGSMNVARTNKEDNVHPK